MSDLPAPLAYTNIENETPNEPPLNEEIHILNNDNNYPESFEVTKDDIITYPKPNLPNRITYLSKCNWLTLIFIILGMAFGIGLSILTSEKVNIVGRICFNIPTLISFIFIFLIKCSSINIDTQQGVIIVRISKIYYCKKDIYKFSDIIAIELRQSSEPDRSPCDTIYYDIVLQIKERGEIIAVTKKGTIADAEQVYNTLKEILSPNINVVDSLPCVR